jgi:hypothetical protein
LLISLKTEYNFFKIMDSIKAIKKAVTKWEKIMIKIK